MLARAIRDLVRDPALARRLGEAGRARVEADFRAETMIDQFADALRATGAGEGDRGYVVGGFFG